MKNNETGFTLIELLLVISIVVALSILVLPSMVRTVQNIETKHFFERLDSDILYVQNSALTQSVDSIRVKFFHDHYRIYSSSNALKKEAYPKHINSRNSIYEINYSKSGTVKEPGTFVFYDDDKRHEITFPFGKGRYYVKTIQ